MMNSNTSGRFFVGSLVTFALLFGLVLIIFNSMQDVTKNVTEPEKMDAETVESRIKPVAEVTVGEPPVVEAPVVTETADTAGGVGEQLVTQVCAACHGAGLMQSPKLGNVSDWAPRIEKGIETLYKHAIEGFNMMPAKGGRADLSDDDIKAAVDYMVQQAQ
ncbi:c-type cytochrome [Methylophaga thiooxydans]|uniref:c-type cytochrome n=1 Tax=Methylophaga thiooxydans TaxID=392484 RepID=UPI002352B120|nr:cytochrome c5 family protein [Methylophaga thiooxydans]